MPTGDIIDKDKMVLGHFSDHEMAVEVRMLMRNDLNHEAVCMAARDRIMYLSQEVERLRGTKSKIKFCLQDQSGEGSDTEALVTLNCLGINVQLKGFSDKSSEDDEGVPVFIEKYQGQVRVVVFADINNEAPTHTINLTKAKNENRLEE